MSSRCKSCGGSLVYDIATKKLKCLYCDSYFEPEEYEEDGAREQTYETTIFTCPNCGGEISTTELSAVDYCMFCGSFVTLNSQLSKVKKPDFILPFEKTMEDCKQIYKRNMRFRYYAPAQLRKEEFLEGFKGIYIPYWNYKYSYGTNFSVRGSTERHSGDMIITQDYTTTAKIDAGAENLMFDASSTFDDEIGTKIAPFDTKKMKPFSASYMYGFYGDTADIKEDTYDKVADEEVNEKIWNTILKNEEVQKGHPQSSVPKDLKKRLGMQKQASLAMFPVWFLTWRNKDRIAYSVINGETGEMYTEVPVSMGRYLLFSLLTALPLFFLLNMTVTFSAHRILVYAIALSIFMTVVYVFQLDKVVRRVMHTDDRGFLAVHEDAKKKSDELVDENFMTIMLSEAWDLIKSLGLFLVIAAVVCFLGVFEYVLFAILVLIFGIPIYTVYRIGKDAKILGDQTVWLDVAGSLFSIIFGAVLLFMDPAPDMPYYISAVICIFGVAFAAYRSMKRYNQILTRPIPRFFQRKGAERL